jgi:hypothetical protein
MPRCLSRITRGGFVNHLLAMRHSTLMQTTEQDVLVGKLWEPEFKDGKTVVILAGYTRQMRDMLQGNPGMQSRFQTTLIFEDWTDSNMIDLILTNAADTKFVGPTPFVFDDDARAELETSLQQLRARPDFGNGRDAETLLKLTIESRDVRVGADLNQLRTCSDGRLLLMRGDVIDATSQMLASRGGSGVSYQHDHSHSDDCVAEKSTRFLQQVFPELQQRFTDSIDLSMACSQMIAAGVTDDSIIRSSNSHDYVSKFLPDGVTVHFLEIFMQLTFRQRPVSVFANALAFKMDT